MKEERVAALRRFLEREGTSRLEVSLDPKAADSLKRLASFGISGDAPEVERMYASRLLEQALEDLGDDPVEGIQQMSARDPSPPSPGDPAPDAVVLGEGGARVQLSDAWREGPGVLVFLRHYG